MESVLVTGGKGVIGSVACRAFEAMGWRVQRFDLAASASSPDHGDIRDSNALNRAMDRCTGVVHLAAVSRVGWGEDDPERCWSINVEGTSAVVSAALRARQKPWLVFVSSREVYGNPERLPVTEEHVIAPINCYGRSKAEGEKIVALARAEGLRAATLRLPSVYGSAADYLDRVAPAFALHAIMGKPLLITGASQVCDFLFIADTVQGLTKVAQCLSAGRANLPVIHLASGRATTLGELADLAKRLTGSTSPIVETPNRSFDVQGFVGNPARARKLLGWAPSVSLEDGMSQLVSGLAARLAREGQRASAE